MTDRLVILLRNELASMQSSTQKAIFKRELKRTLPIAVKEAAAIAKGEPYQPENATEQPQVKTTSENVE